MGMDLSYKEFHLHQNWQGWGALIDLLRANGFEGEIPCGNDGDKVSRETADKVGAALLRFYIAKDKAEKECRMPELSRHEAGCLAYGLMILLSQGETEHW